MRPMASSRCRLSRITFLGFALALQGTSAFASGREGEALVGPVQWTVNVVLGALVVLVLGGGVWGAVKASQGGQSIGRGFGNGLLKGGLAFLILAGIALALLTLGSILWVVYSFVDVYLIKGK